MDMKLEVVVVPVADVDRAKQFYKGLGWREDADFVADEDFRIVQLTPPGSGGSIQFGVGVTSFPPGSLHGAYLVVDDIDAARAELGERGARVSEVFHEARLGARFRPAGAPERQPGPAADRQTYGSFVTFDDPDGNGWIVQEITTRLPGRGDGVPATDVATLADLLHEAEGQHGHYEPSAPPHHWWDWYAAYIVGRQQGRTADEAYGDASAALEAARR